MLQLNELAKITLSDKWYVHNYDEYSYNDKLIVLNTSDISMLCIIIGSSELHQILQIFYQEGISCPSYIL